MKFLQQFKNIKQGFDRHPLTKGRFLQSLWRLFRWQFLSRVSSKPIVQPFIGNLKFWAARGYHGITGNIYYGLHDYTDMLFVLHFLRKEDLFGDVGANMGSYSLLAAGINGCKTIAFEPAPETFEQLEKNILLNELSSTVSLRNMAIGSKRAKLKFTVGKGPMNRFANEDEEHTLEVPVTTLDEEFRLQTPCLLKIDVEGFEMEVLEGAQKVLKDPCLKAILIETFDQEGVSPVSLMLQNEGFVACTYEPVARDLSKGFNKNNNNQIFIRESDVNDVKQRLISAPKIQVLGKSI
jgi:FkbM family methyltransferase